MTVRDFQNELNGGPLSGYRAALKAFLSIFEPGDRAYTVIGSGRKSYVVEGAIARGAIVVEQGRATRLSLTTNKKEKR